MTYQRKTKPAPWVQAKIGGYQAREPKKRKPVDKIKRLRRIRPMSKIRNKAVRVYAFQARLWKVGRECQACGLRHKGKLICGANAHLCTDVHHSRGRSGNMLLDTRYWIALCHDAHTFVHAQPAEAKRLGLLGDGPWNTKPREMETR